MHEDYTRCSISGSVKSELYGLSLEDEELAAISSSLGLGDRSRPTCQGQGTGTTSATSSQPHPWQDSERVRTEKWEKAARNGETDYRAAALPHIYDHGHIVSVNHRHAEILKSRPTDLQGTMPPSLRAVQWRAAFKAAINCLLLSGEPLQCCLGRRRTRPCA